MRYQVITWTKGEGHDERREFSTLAQARACARVGIYDFRLGVIRETLGRFPDI